MRVVLRKLGGQVVKLLHPHLLEADDIGYLRSYHVSAERFSMNPIILAVGGTVVSYVAAKHFHVVSPLAKSPGNATLVIAAVKAVTSLFPKFAQAKAGHEPCVVTHRLHANVRQI